jgi:intein-encoded DNA endonuclease-like protein
VCGSTDFTIQQGRLNNFRPDPTPELAYVIGVILGDGNLNIHGYSSEMILAVTDHDFAEEFSKCLSRVLHRETPYKIRWSRPKNRWVVQGSSILLHKFLDRHWNSFKQCRLVAPRDRRDLNPRSSGFAAVGVGARCPILVVLAIPESCLGAI